MQPTAFTIDDESGHYLVEKVVSEKDILRMANHLTRQGLKKGAELTSPDKTYSFLQHKLQNLEHEVFGIIFLNQQHQILKYEEMFRGTINCSSVYPREIAKQALSFNAAAVILVHNHPSGCLTPSQSDITLTKQIESSLDLLEIRTLDHLIVSTDGYVSLKEKGDF